jgi:large repetitive protein
MFSRNRRTSSQPRLCRTISVAACVCVASLLSLACSTPALAKANIGLSIYPAKGAPGDTVTLKSLVLSGGLPVSGLMLEFFVDGSSVGTSTSDATGVSLSYSIPGGMPEGLYDVKVTFAGDGTYNPASRTTAALTVQIPKAGVGFSIYPVTGSIEAPVLLKTLVYSGGAPVSGLLIQFAVDGVPVGSGTSDATGASYSYTIPAGTTPGLHDVTVSFAGDAAYYPATRTTAALTAKLDTFFSLYAVSGEAGTTVTLRSLLYGGPAPASGLTVQFAVNGVPVGSSVSDGTEVALSYPIPLGTANGVYDVTVTFAGDATHNPTTRTTAALRVGPAQANVVFSLYAVSGNADTDVTLKSLVYSGGAPASGLLIDFLVDGVPAGSATSDGTGASLVYHIPSGMSPGVYNVTVSFAGDATHTTGSRTEAALTVK